MRELLDWLSTLPDPLLYGAIVLAAFAENVFPPLPADTVIALGAFVAARGNGTALGVWAATMVGNIGGAMFMYWIGHRFGLPWLSRRFPALLPADASERFAERFKAQGMLAVVVSRFLPAIRAVVPPVAGALAIGAVRAGIAMTLASGAWYGIVCLLAFRAGENADTLLASVAGQQRLIGGIAVGVALVLLLVWWVWRRRRQAVADGGGR
ncbi:MAG TPA: VTT domain-containing protein [Gemmatimonas sp.]|uniref:DedA family protein n=1 Tax=Gemmatimonas sp. TaxID=1962908 RepID=UPI002EDA2ED4